MGWFGSSVARSLPSHGTRASGTSREPKWTKCPKARCRTIGPRSRRSTETATRAARVTTTRPPLALAGSCLQTDHTRASRGQGSAREDGRRGGVGGHPGVRRLRRCNGGQHGREQDDRPHEPPGTRQSSVGLGGSTCPRACTEARSSRGDGEARRPRRGSGARRPEESGSRRRARPARPRRPPPSRRSPRAGSTSPRPLGGSGAAWPARGRASPRPGSDYGRPPSEGRGARGAVRRRKRLRCLERADLHAGEPSGFGQNRSVTSARDLEQGYTLPWSWYSSEELTHREQERIFRRAWIYACPAGWVAEPGEYAACSAGDVPLVVVRGRDGELQAFVNVCRHRGSQIALGRGRRETLQCPYQAWTYDLDGSLRAAPRSEREQSFERSDLSLRPALVLQQLGPFVFVCADLDAPPL